MAPKRKKLLSSTRPAALAKTKTSKLSSKTTQSIISNHHTLQKQLTQAVKIGDEQQTKAIETEIKATGGLKLYQAASTLGQSRERGGDTSKALVEWLGLSKTTAGEDRLRVLEVGALSTKNALNIDGVTAVRRVDLHSQEAGIEERDFMDMDADETWQGERGYDVLSLSLVVNYVSEPKARGSMLEHTVDFLRCRQREDRKALPALFLVLPLPCIDNSRYLTEEHLQAVMTSLGYQKTKSKRSSKLYYSLWSLLASDEHSLTLQAQRPFKKTELRGGKDRNNFCIVLDYNSRPSSKKGVDSLRGNLVIDFSSSVLL